MNIVSYNNKSQETGGLLNFEIYFTYKIAAKKKESMGFKKTKQRKLGRIETKKDQQLTLSLQNFKVSVKGNS